MLSSNPMDFEEWFSSETAEVSPTSAAVCPRHALGVEAICARCGVFCCEACVDSRDHGLCEACGRMASDERLRAVTRGLAWKLALAPAFITFSAISLALRHHEVPAAFALFVVPLACALGVLRTGRPAFAWLGAVVSVGVLGWVLAGLAQAEDWRRVIDVALLAIAPVVALKGCAELSRSRTGRWLQDSVAEA